MVERSHHESPGPKWLGLLWLGIFIRQTMQWKENAIHALPAKDCATDPAQVPVQNPAKKPHQGAGQHRMHRTSFDITWDAI